MVTIRPANKNEVKNFQNLNDDIFIDNQKYDRDIDMRWAQSDKGTEENGRKIGYIAAGPKAISYCKSKYMEIKNMGVIPKYRLQGIGGWLSFIKETDFQR